MHWLAEIWDMINGVVYLLEIVHLWLESCAHYLNATLQIIIGRISYVRLVLQHFKPYLSFAGEAQRQRGAASA